MSTDPPSVVRIRKTDHGVTIFVPWDRVASMEPADLLLLENPLREALVAHLDEILSREQDEDQKS